MDINDYISSFTNECFEWGKVDCLTFVHGWYIESTGKNSPVFPDTPYSTEGDAAKTLREVFRNHDVSSVPALFDKLMDRCDPITGAVCLIQTGKHGIVSSHQAGLCNSKWSMVTTSAKGLVMMPVDSTMCWRIQ